MLHRERRSRSPTLCKSILMKTIALGREEHSRQSPFVAYGRHSQKGLPASQLLAQSVKYVCGQDGQYFEASNY